MFLHRHTKTELNEPVVDIYSMNIWAACNNLRNSIQKPTKNTQMYFNYIYFVLIIVQIQLHIYVLKIPCNCTCGNLNVCSFETTHFVLNAL